MVLAIAHLPSGAVCRAGAAGVGDLSGIQGEFCAKTAKRRAMDGELPVEPSKEGVYSSIRWGVSGQRASDWAHVAQTD